MRLEMRVSPSGFQWFDLMNQTSDEILTKSLVAEIKLNKLINEVKIEYNIAVKLFYVVLVKDA